MNFINILLPDETEFIQSYANHYFTELLGRHCQFLMHHNQLVLSLK